MMMLVICAAAIAVAFGKPTDPTPPVFPTAWQATETLEVVQQGRTQRGTAVSHFDLPNNRTASTNLTHSEYDTVITLYHEDLLSAREYFIQTYGGERHCRFWCQPDFPITCDSSDSLCSYDYKNKATYVGDETVDGVNTHRFFWTENLGPIPMNSLLLYVNAQLSDPTPVRMLRNIHPFGKPIGNETTDFVDFTPMPNGFPEAVFDLGPDYKYQCSSPVAGDECQSEAVKAVRRMRHQSVRAAEAIAKAQN